MISPATAGWFPNLELLDSGASEEEILAWLVVALGEPTMQRYGDWWRQRVRESRRGAVVTCLELLARFTAVGRQPLRNPGIWARDMYFRIRAAEGAATATTKTNEP